MNKPAVAAKKSNWYRRLPVNAQAVIIVSVVLFIIFVLPLLIYSFAPNPGQKNLSTVPYPPTETLAKEELSAFQYYDSIRCARIIDEEDAEKFEEAIKQAPEWKRVSSLPPDVTEWLYGEDGALHFRHQKVLYAPDGYYMYKDYSSENESLENNYDFKEGNNWLRNIKYVQYDPANRELTFIVLD